MRKAVIGLLVASVLLVMGVLRGADLATSHEAALQSAETRAATLVLILSEYMAQTFSAGDAMLRQLALHSQRIGGPAEPERDWAPSLASARAGVTGIGSISILDRDLTIRHSTRRDIVGQSRRGETVFQRPLAAPSDDLIVGTPFLSPVVPNGYLIPLGRRLTSAAGIAEGAVVASFIPADLRRFFQSIHVGERGALWVLHDAGMVIVREPSPGDFIGQSARDNALFKAAAHGADQGVLRAVVEPGGREQVAAFRRAGALPVTLAVSLDRDEILVPWRHEVTGFALSSIIVTAVLAVTLLVLFRQMDAKAAADRALMNARREEAEHLREAHSRLAETLEREQEARREAEAANALKDQFVMNVSHELRTPLTAMAGWSRMLVDGMVSDDRRDSALRIIERNAQAQIRLIEDLLDVSGVMTGKLRLDIRDVVITDVVRNAIEALQPAAAAKGIQVDVNLDPRAGTIAADAARVQQIVWNLLANAVKFTASGGRIGVIVAPADASVEIRVTDTGLGISPELLPHVFERFRQAPGRKPHPHGGLGLGLAIVQSLVELHRGTILARSDGHGKGSTFIVYLPTTPPPASGYTSVASVTLE